MLEKYRKMNRITSRTGLYMNFEKDSKNKRIAKQIVQKLYRKVLSEAQQFANDDNPDERTDIEQESFFRWVKYYLGGVIADIQLEYSEVAQKFNQNYGRSLSYHPKWANQIMFNGYGVNDNGKVIYTQGERIDIGADHVARIVLNGKSVVVSNPYHLNKDNVCAMLEVANKLSLDFVIRGESPYFPSNTLMVLFKKLKKPKQISEHTMIE